MTDADTDAETGPRVLERPGSAEAVSTILSAIEAGHVVSIVGRCVVERVGRRGSEPGPDDRLVLVKPDGAVTVQGRTGTSPLFEFAGDRFEATEVEGRLRIEAEGGSAKHRIEFERVDLLSRFSLDDVDDRTAAGTDRHEQLRDRLLDDPDLVEPGFRPLSTERGTAAGPIDLYGRDDRGRAVVVEIKAHRAGPAAVGQLDRYVSALERDLHADAEVRGVLVAPSATERTRDLLAERGFAFRSLPLGG